MYLLDNAGSALKTVAVSEPQLRNKTKPSPEEFIAAYRQGLRHERFTGRMVFIEDYVDGHLRRYRIEEPRMIHRN